MPAFADRFGRGQFDRGDFRLSSLADRCGDLWAVAQMHYSVKLNFRPSVRSFQQKAHFVDAVAAVEIGAHVRARVPIAAQV